MNDHNSRDGEGKACPFCGGKPTEIEGALTGRTLVECQMNGCPLLGVTMLLDEWNRRCEPEGTTDWYANRLPKEISIHEDQYGPKTTGILTMHIREDIWWAGYGMYQGEEGDTLTEALKKLWEWCVVEGHAKEEE